MFHRLAAELLATVHICCRFVLSDPGLKELFNADYCVTELGGASIPDFRLRPTLSFFQSTAEKGETESDSLFLETERQREGGRERRGREGCKSTCLLLALVVRPLGRRGGRERERENM